MRHEINRIQSIDHNIESHRINKIYLFYYDDQKFILKDGYSRLSHFHKSTFSKMSKFILLNIDNLL